MPLKSQKLCGKKSFEKEDNDSTNSSTNIWCSGGINYRKFTSIRFGLRVLDVFTERNSFCDLLGSDIRQCDTSLMSISILSESIRTLNALNPSFMYSKLLKEILIEIEYDLIDFLSN
ncbi:hypothetical protein I4U23_014966 [Adineta vaga]|nr:hypothetical protein I4U23_014966 [Adineta vaga]